MSQQSAGSTISSAVATLLWEPVDSTALALWETSDRLIASVNAEGTFVRQNPAWHAALGYSIEEASRLSMFDLIDPGSEHHCEAMVDKLRSGEVLSSFSAVLVAKGGAKVHVKGMAAPLMTDGKAVGWVSLLTNVSTSEEHIHKLEAIVHTHGYDSVVLDFAKTRVEYPDELETFRHKCTEAIADALEVERVGVWRKHEGVGLRCEDLFVTTGGKHTCGDVLARADYPIYFEAIDTLRALVMNDVMSDPMAAELAASYLPSLGISSMLDVPLRSAGSLIGVLCCEHVGERRVWKAHEQTFVSQIADQISRAIGEVETAEVIRSVKAEAIRLANLVDSTADGIVTISTAGIVESFNNAAEQLFGYTATEVVGNNVSMLMGEEHARQHDSYIGRFVAGGEARVVGVERQVEGVRKNGTVVPLSLRVTEASGKKSFLIGVLRDVTEQIHQREKLQGALDQLEMLVATANVWIVILDERGIVLQWNPQAERESGWKAEEAVGYPLSKVTNPQPESEFADIKTRALDGESFSDLGFSVETKGGETRHMSVNMAPLRSLHGTGRRVICVASDVSERVASASVLERQRSMLAAINSAQSDVLAGRVEGHPFDPLLEAVLSVTDSEYGFIGEGLVDDAGQPYLRTHALTNIAWDAASHAFYDDNIAMGLEFRKLDTLFGQVLRTREVLIANDAPNHPAAGGIPPGHPPLNSFVGLPLAVGDDLVGMIGLANRPTEYTSELLDEIDPMVTTALGLLQFIIAQQQVQKVQTEISRASSELTQLVDTANAPIFGVDSQLRVNEWNQCAARITGFSKDTVMGRPLVNDFIAEDYQESVRAVLENALRGVETANYDFPLFTRSGERLEVLLNATTRRDLDGSINGVIGIGQDVTDSKRVEAELHEERKLLAQRVEERTADLKTANAQLASASRTKDAFLASMSHELRTPLNAILSTTESLEEGVYEALHERQIRPVKMIDESGRHLLSLINDILDLSKIEAGKIDLRLMPVSLEEVVSASLRFIKEEAQKRRIRVSTIFDSTVESVVADERRLKQMLVNLLGNAVKFSQEGGIVGVEVSHDEEQEAVAIAVWDDGIGISAENQLKLFQPFIQLDAGLDRHYSGTGLGLTLVARMAELHEGSVSVESAGEGCGSRFTIVLPTGLQPDAMPKAPPSERSDPSSVRVAAPGHGEGKLILLAEDNEANIESMSAYLLSKGFRLIVAHDGEEALRLAEEEHPDLILMDVQMPKMDGLTATRKLRQNPDLGSTPIITLTALAMEGDRERCLEAGANEYLSKPVSLKGLVAMMTALLAG